MTVPHVLLILGITQRCQGIQFVHTLVPILLAAEQSREALLGDCCRLSLELLEKGAGGALPNPLS